jgi:hypothetical protein
MAVEELVSMFEGGELVDRDEWHTVKTMVAKGLA